MHKFVVKTKSGSLYFLEVHHPALQGRKWLIITPKGKFYVVSLIPSNGKRIGELEINDFIGKSIYFAESEHSQNVQLTTYVDEVYQRIL